jgi:TonB family protein
MVGALLGSSVVALAAWPLTPMRTAAQATAELAKPTVDGAADRVQIGNRLPVAIPDGVFGAGVGEVIADVAIDVDAQGAVTSARVATITVTGNERGSASVATTPAIDTMVAGAVDTISALRFRAPAEGHGALIVRVRFDAETRAAIVTRLYTTSGYPKPAGLRVGGAVLPPQKIVNVQPEYPEEAKAQQVQGVVILEVSLDAKGVPEDVQVLRGIPQLDAAAIAAVQQWRYQPTLMNGIPTPVLMTVTVNFTLAP